MNDVIYSRANKFLIGLILLLGVVHGTRGNAGPLALSYSGRLSGPDGAPSAGPVDLEVRFFVAAEGGENLLAEPLRYPSTPLVDGIFQIKLELSADERHRAIGEAGTWIEVTNSNLGLTYPRQAFHAVPYALNVPVDGKSIRFDDEGRLSVGPKSLPAADEFLTRDGAGNWIWKSTPTVSGGAATPSVTAVVNQACPAGQYLQGFDGTGVKLCTTLPPPPPPSTPVTEVAGKVCAAGLALTGFDVTGAKLCAPLDATPGYYSQDCGSGKYLQGFTSTGAKICTSLPSPAAPVTEVAGRICPVGEALTGFDTSGNKLCAPLDATPGYFSQLCAAGAYLQGFDAAGAKICQILPASQNLAGTTCPAGQVLQGFDVSGNKLCYQLAGPPVFAKMGKNGYAHHCAILSDKTLQCWGYNYYGELGDRTTGSRSVPVYVRNQNGTKVSGVESAGGGNGFTCFSKTDGTVWCLGYGANGRLGDGSTSNSLFPVQVDGITNAVAVATGWGHACALLATGGVSCWGANLYGQLGNDTYADQSEPVDVAIAGVTQISVGDVHTCALKSDRTIWCWGHNGYGQLGNGSTVTSKIPIRVDNTSLNAPTQIAAASSYSGGNLYGYTCAINADRSVWCWGYNGSGELGDRTTVSRSAPVQVKLGNNTYLAEATEIRTSGFVSCAILSDRTVKCWGYDGYGQLCNDETSLSLSHATTVQDFGGGGAMSNVVDLAINANSGSAIVMIRSDGTAASCGYGANGELGNNTFTSYAYLPQGVVAP